MTRAEIAFFACTVLLLGCGDDGGDSGDAAAGLDAGARQDAVVERDGAASDAPRSDATPPPSDARPPGDAAGTDAGPALVCSPDPGPAPGDCVLHVPAGSFGPLNNDCYPRCTAATATTYRACTTQSCRDDAVGGDGTPRIGYFIGSVPVTPGLDCAGCVKYQEFHCFSVVCGDEVDSYVDDCIAGTDPTACDLTLARLDNCLALLTPAENGMVDACFASHDGPQACFPCE